MLPPNTNSKDDVTATRIMERVLVHQRNVGLAQKLNHEVQYFAVCRS